MTVSPSGSMSSAGSVSKVTVTRGLRSRLSVTVTSGNSTSASQASAPVETRILSGRRMSGGSSSATPPPIPWVTTMPPPDARPPATPMPVVPNHLFPPPSAFALFPEAWWFRMIGCADARTESKSVHRAVTNAFRTAPPW